jgi:hypothetical protein
MQSTTDRAYFSFLQPLMRTQILIKCPQNNHKQVHIVYNCNRQPCSGQCSIQAWPSHVQHLCLPAGSLDVLAKAVGHKVEGAIRGYEADGPAVVKRQAATITRNHACHLMTAPPQCRTTATVLPSHAQQRAPGMTTPMCPVRKLPTTPPSHLTYNSSSKAEPVSPE